jgi:competence/damage-inducible protein CinA-like protein
MVHGMPLSVSEDNMHAELITSGSELLLGQLVDTNSAFIARALRNIGLNLFYKTTVGDNQDRMVQVLRTAMARADVVITTGGLGPTVDDVTRPAVALATGRELEFRPELLEQIAARFRNMRVPMGENNRRQAFVPRGAIAVENPVGTAPAFVVEHEHSIVISVPGVPSEMEYLMTRAIVPYLQKKLDLHEIIFTRTLRAVGLGESRIDAAIADLQTGMNPTVGLSAHPGQTDIRIAAKATSEQEARALIAPVEAQIRQRLDSNIYGADDETLEGTVACLLGEKQQKLASVESGTGGQLAGRLAGAPASRGVFVGGRVLTELGCSAEEAARALHQEMLGQGVTMAVAASADIIGDHQLTISTALATPEGVRTSDRDFRGSPRLGAEWAVNAALGLVWKYLQEEAAGSRP